MRPIQVAAAVINQLPLDWDGNQRRIAAAIASARERGVGLLLLPEMCIPGYGCEDAFHSIAVLHQSARVLGELLPLTRGLVVTFGLPVLHHNGLFNAVALVADGRILGLVAKRFLAGDGIHYEPRWFKPWQEGVVAEIDWEGNRLPIGDLLFEVGGVRIGFEICEDAWVANRPGAGLARAGADLILNPSASHFAFAKRQVRRNFVIEGSRAFGVSYVYANLLGNEAGRIIYDGGALIASGGKLVAEGPRLGLGDWHLTAAVIDVEATRMQQARTGSFRPVLEDRAIVRAAFDWPGVGKIEPAPLPAWESGPYVKEEEFTRAVTLGLWDHLRKSRSKGWVVSLSGGCDSAAVTILCTLALVRAVQELGMRGVRAALAHIPGVGELPDNDDGSGLTTRLLTTVYQGSRNSSATTREAARAVAAAAGSHHLEFDIAPLVYSYTRMVETAIGRTLDWNRDDLALQNIQARVRGPGVWMLANLEDKLLLTTSNRSEAAVGYATMDGDTCGGLAPIAGIDKAFLRHWLDWLQRIGADGLGAVPALAVVTSQRSTPELRPTAAKQVSEEDLMPFAVLDLIERLAIRDKLPPAAIAWRLVQDLPDTTPEQAATWVRRFTTLFARNQWKRERLAPAFHLDDENLDPKTWCRFPILSGGFVRELAELDSGTAARVRG
ncbi:NAD(+) synthase [Planctomycetota bacterium]|nr:NAD(+) synthase [Planctomycetota bacterium]